MLYGRIRPLWFYYIDEEAIGFGALKMKLFFKAIFENDGRVTLNLCFGDASLIIRKALTITGFLRLLLSVVILKS